MLPGFRASQAQCKEHMKVHNPPRSKPNACFVCDDNFATMDELKVHMTKHTEEKPFKCNECDYKCSEEVMLRQHMACHISELPEFMSKSQFPPIGNLGMNKDDVAWGLDNLARQHLVDTLLNNDGWSRPFMNGKQMKTKRYINQSK